MIDELTAIRERLDADDWEYIDLSKDEVRVLLAALAERDREIERLKTENKYWDDLSRTALSARDAAEHNYEVIARRLARYKDPVS